MEGRTIARPNVVRDDRGRLGDGTSMEGRTIARPNPLTGALVTTLAANFNGGPDNCPAKPGDRAGRRAADLFTSMEGRTIARPNADAGRRPFRHVLRTSMEGRTIARPNPGARQLRRPGRGTSMEGRTIARPNRRPPGRPSPGGALLQWRAGQLPGQTADGDLINRWTDKLQWRAGQLPGQTRHRARDCPRDQLTSMEGRTIARPNHQRHRRFRPGHGTSMEGRTIARPNPPAVPSPPRGGRNFNGGPDNCPAKQAAPGTDTNRT